MNKGWRNPWVLVVLLVVVFAGCATQSGEVNTRQADIGLGIVEGTKGYQQIQLEEISLKGFGTEIKGQVIRIEGAAYVVEMLNHRQVRLPFDENTRIDRPAHIGDWIKAYVDHDGGTRLIQNIDDQIVLD